MPRLATAFSITNMKGENVQTFCWTHTSNRLIYERHGPDNNDGALSLCEHNSIGTLNVVAFWQSACQDCSVHRGGAWARKKELRGTTFVWGMKSAQCPGKLHNFKDKTSSEHKSSGRWCQAQLSTLLRTNL